MAACLIGLVLLFCILISCIDDPDPEHPMPIVPTYRMPFWLKVVLWIGGVLLGIGTLVQVIVGDAWGHSWYPPVCCSDRDCYPLPSGYVQEEASGFLLKETGEFIPASEAANGRDEDFHICRNSKGARLCFFKPNRGM